MIFDIKECIKKNGIYPGDTIPGRINGENPAGKILIKAPGSQFINIYKLMYEGVPKGIREIN